MMRIKVTAGINIAVAICCMVFIASCGGGRGVATKEPAGKVVTHRVVEGATWESIAGEFLGDPGRGAEIAVFNGKDPASRPEAGSGVKIPLSDADSRQLDRAMRASREYNKGIELASDGNYQDAVDRFREALRIDPQLLDASYNLGVTYQKIGMHQEALEILKGLEDRGMRTPDYYYALGVSAFHTRDYDKAADSFHEVLKISPDHLKALFSIAAVYVKTGRRDDAIEALRRYIAIAPEGEWKDEARSRLEGLESSD